MKLYQIWNNAFSGVDTIKAESLDDALEASKARAEAYYATAQQPQVRFYANQCEPDGTLIKFGMASGCLGRRVG